VDSAGDIHVVWLDDRPGNHEVYYRKYTSSTGIWGAEQRRTWHLTTGIDENDQPTIEVYDRGAPGVVVDSEDNLFVSFENRTSMTPQVLRYDATAADWDLFPTDLGTGGTADTNPVLAVDNSNNVHAIWRGMVAGQPQIFYRKYTPEAGWGTEEQITTELSQKQTPTLTVDTSGDVHVVWADSRDTPIDEPPRYEIYYNKKPSTGGWETDTRLTNALDSDSLKPYIAEDASGNLHIVWEDDRDGNFEIYYRFYEASSSAWGSEQRLTNAAHASRGPHLSVDPSGQLHLIWTDNRHSGIWGWTHTSLYYRKKSAVWGTEKRLVREGWWGSITADSSSRLHIAYSAELATIGNPEVYYLQFDPSVRIAPSPKEVVLVLDVSGSMSWREDGTVPADPTESRLYKAGQALSNFLDRLNLRNPTDVYFGLVTFPDSSGLCPSAQKVIPGSGSLAPLNEGTRETAIRTTIPDLTGGGKTPMAEGLTLANGLLSPAEANKMFLLVSDGYHNCPSRAFPGGLEGYLSSFTDPIYTVGIGTAREVDFTSLSDIATTTGGDFLDTTIITDLDLMSSFKTIIVSTMGLEAESDPSGEIVSGQRRKHTARITDQDTDIAFDLSWSTPREGHLLYELHTPDGKVLTPGKARALPGVTYISRETYQIYYLTEEYLKTIKRTGQWGIEISGEEMAKGEKEVYRYGVVMDSPLKMLPEFIKRVYRTGEPVGLQVTIQEDGKRLPADIQVMVRSPREGLGNWLVKTPVSKQAVEKKKRVETGDPLPGHVLKALLIAEDYQRPFPETPHKMSFALYDDGTHGDLTANDGIYSNLFIDTKVPGTYTFDIVAKGKNTAGQIFRRQEIIQKHLQVNVKEASTEVKIEGVPPGRPDVKEYKVTIIPKDPSGNYLGPGHADRISFFVKEATFVGMVRDNLDGSYSQRFQFPASAVCKCMLVRARVLGGEMAFCVPTAKE
jgi:Mg-chelatase subunit ChlD